MTKKLYKTSNLALCPFLVMNGINYIGCEIDEDDPNKIVFIFRDDQNRAKDIAILFPRSNEHQYHSLWSYMRNQLSIAKKAAKNG